ncbi:MAG: hypothetical protein J0L53_11145 [Spirochaetes bacterium]|nr:hypothetical protein [Spirochaetota bacterium]MBX3721563.1 hypothetical protein [Turneriella sp.]
MRFLAVLLIPALLVPALADNPQPLAVDPQLNPLPPEALAFPEFSENYRAKITGGDYEIWSEEKLQRWSSAQGLRVTTDHQGAGLQYRRAAIIAAPGLSFVLRRPVTEKGSEFANGWRLNLDLAAIRLRDGLSGKYLNVLECDVHIDGVFFRRIRQGGSETVETPVQIQIPHIRSAEGKVTIELKLANHPRNFLFLYDAYLSR